MASPFPLLPPAQPFVCGRYMWMHNGGVGGFHRVRRRLLDSLNDDVYQQCPSFESDSAICFALFLNQIEEPMQQLGPGGCPLGGGAGVRAGGRRPRKRSRPNEG